MRPSVTSNSALTGVELRYGVGGVINNTVAMTPTGNPDEWTARIPSQGTGVTISYYVVAENAERVGVMYAGRLVEEAPVAALFDDPRHPYTQSLLKAQPRGPARDGDRRLPTIPGSVPDPAQPPTKLENTSNTGIAGGQAEKFVVVKPVVVAIDTAWNRPLTIVSLTEANVPKRNKAKMTMSEIATSITVYARNSGSWR